MGLGLRVEMLPLLLIQTGSIANAPAGFGVGPCLLPEQVLQPFQGAVPAPLLSPYPFMGGCFTQIRMASCVLLSVSPFLAFFFCPLPSWLGCSKQCAQWHPELGWQAELSPAQPIFPVAGRGCTGRRAALRCCVSSMLPCPVQLQVPSLPLSICRQWCPGKVQLVWG